MRALLQRLSGLDDVAESAVQIIELFDKLAQEQFGLEGLVRSAALFSECAVGVAGADGTVIVRVASDGRALEPLQPRSATAHTVNGGGEVWLEREGPAHALDALVLERFAAAVAVTRKRKRPARHSSADRVELLIQRTASEDDRLLAIERFGLVPASPIRLLAVGPAD
ncbi:MAG TPA: hypothetical protein VHB30_03775, partial [Solirubrobacteraceae bacterium]|nr:hypothetical protein [Solirubrobacteraceae bacterium]